MKNYKPIIIVPGDPNSVFYEIFFKAIKIKKLKSPLLIIGNYNDFLMQMKRFNFKKKINLVTSNNLNSISKTFINIINIDLKNKKKKHKYIEECFKIAFDLLKLGITHKLLNAPINKKKFLKRKYLGITEYISKKFLVNQTGMLIFNKKLSVSPVTTHLPISMVSKNISKKIILEKIKIINEFYKKYLIKNPKIAVTGLNPHCESILKYDEDKKIITSAIILAKKKGYKVKGPYSGDTIFLKNNRNKFDVILGMYHDQVLAPFKSLFEYDAINVTMGLPFLRVSPDHGPNESMIWKNKSNPLSIIKCLDFLDKK